MSYKILGDFIRKVDHKNKDMKILNLQGLSMTKEFRKSTSNIVGTDLSKYKIVKQGQFCCDFMSVIRVHKLPVVLNNLGEDVIISPAYVVFEVIDENLLLPEYLMLWFRRTEFDRYADFRCDSSIRGGFQWEELCEVELPIPSIEKQREIVAQYQAVANKIKVNEQICEQLEATAQTLYKQWFVDFEFPNEEGQPYKSSGGTMVYNEELEKEIPEGWEVKSLGELTNLITDGKHGNSEDEYNSGFYFISAKDINNELIDYTNARQITYKDFDETHRRTNLQTGDTLITNSGTIGKLAYIFENKINRKTTFQKSVAILKPKIDSIFFFQTIKFFVKDLIELSGGSTQSNLLLGDLRDFKVLLPLDECLLIYNSVINPIINQSYTIKIQNQKLTQLQSLLLSRLATLEG